MLQVAIIKARSFRIELELHLRKVAQVRFCDSFPASVRDPFLQYRDRREFDHRLQHEHPAAERTLRSGHALGIYALYYGELSNDRSLA
jgi:hypothetical protein